MHARFAVYRLPSLLLLIAVLVTACSLGPTRGDGGSAPVLLHIENGQFEAVTVSLMRNGVPLRVGVVEGLAKRTLRIPEAYLGSGADLALRAESAISPHIQVSPYFQIERGESIRWAVRGSMALSTFSVR